MVELLKDPLLKRKYEASLRYRQLITMEQKAGKGKKQIEPTFKETRAGKNADEDFERLKIQLQQPHPTTPSARGPVYQKPRVYRRGEMSSGGPDSPFPGRPVGLLSG
jgi:hypothetical protein